MNLGHINRGNNYHVILRNGTCVTGKIQSVNPDSMLVVNSNEGSSTVRYSKARVTRLDVLQIKDGLKQCDILYSARSSWSDVQSVPSSSREYLSVTLKSGSSIEGKPTSATDSQLSIKKFNAVSDIAKTDIAFVHYIRIKPAPADLVREFPAEFFDPRIWPYILNVGVHMQVLLYDSTLVEDNSVLQCPGRK
jgi:hypothetical protein